MPVSVYSSDDLAKLNSGVPVVNGALGSVELSGCPDGKRYYFYLKSEGGAEAIVAERLLPLDGGTNFRDCGGYPAANGRRVKWNRLYRSGYMSKLSSADVDYLGNLGIKICCDFRGDKEMKRLIGKCQKLYDSHVDENRLRPLLEVRENYLGSALDHIEKKYGTPEQYLLKNFSIDQKALDTLQYEFTE